jgi:hypothetical protein
VTLYCSEHARLAFSGVGVTSVPLAAYSLSSASTFVFPQGAAEFVRLTADAGCYVAFSTSTTAVLSSTNAIRIGPTCPRSSSRYRQRRSGS